VKVQTEKWGTDRFNEPTVVARLPINQALSLNFFDVSSEKNLAKILILPILYYRLLDDLLPLIHHNKEITCFGTPSLGNT
jgi:hypothetical protein